jgi:hypothetical protein
MTIMVIMVMIFVVSCISHPRTDRIVVGKPEIPTTTAKQITFETNSGDFGTPNNDPVRPRMANATDNEDHDHDDHDGHDHGGSGAIQIGATLASAVAFFAVLVI